MFNVAIADVYAEWEVPVSDQTSPCGGVAVQTFKVDKVGAALHNLKAGRWTYIAPGEYKRLIIDHDVVMSNTRLEKITNAEFVSVANGNILINGLGLGLVIERLLYKHSITPGINKITVIESDKRVIDIVAPYYSNNPLVQIIHADAFTYRPPRGVVYDAVWHDIWPLICESNLPEMVKLKRKYKSKTKWQGCWAEDLCRLRKKGIRV